MKKKKTELPPYIKKAIEDGNFNTGKYGKASVDALNKESKTKQTNSRFQTL